MRSLLCNEVKMHSITIIVISKISTRFEFEK